MTNDQSKNAEPKDFRTWWQTSIIDMAPGKIVFRGEPIEELIGNISFVDMIAFMVSGRRLSAGESRLLESALVAGVDHGPQAPSIAAARMAATCGVGLNNAMATAVNMLGDVHGGAGEQCAELYMAIAARMDEMASSTTDRVKSSPSEALTPLTTSKTTPTTVSETNSTRANLTEAVAAEVAATQKRKGKIISGFGHRFHKPVDPRAPRLLALVREAAKAGTVSGRFADIGEAVQAELEKPSKAFQSRPSPSGETRDRLGKQSQPQPQTKSESEHRRMIPMNIDGATAVIFCELGFPPPLARGLFCLSRSVGILAHAWEQMQQGGRNKGPMPPSYYPLYVSKEDTANEKVDKTNKTDKKDIDKKLSSEVS